MNILNKSPSIFTFSYFSVYTDNKKNPRGEGNKLKEGDFWVPKLRGGKLSFIFGWWFEPKS